MEGRALAGLELSSKRMGTIIDVGIDLALCSGILFTERIILKRKLLCEN
jgi:hypothetical protein